MNAQDIIDSLPKEDLVMDNFKRFYPELYEQKLNSQGLAGVRRYWKNGQLIVRSLK